MEYFLLTLLPLLIAGFYLFLRRTRSSSPTLPAAETAEARASAAGSLHSHIATTLSTQLTLARAPADILLAKPPDHLSPEEQQMLIAIRHNLDRMEEVLHEINMLEDAERLKFATLHLPSYIAQIQDGFEPMIKTRCIRFRKKLDLHANTEFILTDTLKLDKIVLNMLLHSFFHTPENGSIGVLLHTRQLPDKSVQLRFTVSDTGPAIPKDDLPNPGRWHYRGGRSITGDRAGANMRLYADIAGSLGGSLQAASNEAGGAAFTVSLRCLAGSNHPELNEKPALDARDELPPPEQPAGDLHIVEDDHETAALLQSCLKGYFNVYLHGSAEEFLHFAAQHAGMGSTGFDAVLIDNMLPGMDGLELLRTIRQHTLLKHIPALVLSSNSVSAGRQQAFQLGADAFIVKPFRLPELRLQILNAVHRYTMHPGDARAKPALNLETRITAGRLILDTVPSKRKEWMQQIIQIIEANIDDELLSVPVLARQTAVSERQLFRLIKESTGLSPNQVILEIRLNKALHLLQNAAELSISDIARQVGMNNPSYFAIAFKKRFGKSPSDLKK